MTRIETNRDLYVAITGLARKHRASDRTLEEFLRALWETTIGYREEPLLSADLFFGLLSDAFVKPVPSFEENWRLRYDEDFADLPGFVGCEACLIRQVVDLHEMAEQGMLDDKLRYFGLDSPRDQCWYNFEPGTFLECATMGAFGGWESTDQTGRDFVPGPVVVMGNDNSLEGRDPRDIDEPVLPFRTVSWEEFHEFLINGQVYE